MCLLYMARARWRSGKHAQLACRRAEPIVLAAAQAVGTTSQQCLDMLLILAAVLCMQDVFALMPRYSQRAAKEEVINDPTVTKHYWRYR